MEPLYCEENGRPSLDPVTLIKLPVLQYMFGIRSMRRTVQVVEANNAYRWFLGLGLQDPVPHFSTFSKNYTRRFKDTDLFEHIFQKILAECFAEGMVDPSVAFVDSTHVKARANGKKYKDEVAQEQALWYAEELKNEIQQDREAHGKKPLKDIESPDDTDDDNTAPPAEGTGKGKPNKNTSWKKLARQKKEKHRKISTVDPESGWFRKWEHKHVFAYNVQTACDRHGIILGSSVHPGNENDGRTFAELYEKILHFHIEVMVGDTAYKTPAIFWRMENDGIKLLSTYNRPKTQKGYFPKSAYVYDEHYDCYLCPADEVLAYHTTNRDGYREYKSDPAKCAHCPYLAQCTAGKDHVKDSDPACVGGLSGARGGKPVHQWNPRMVRVEKGNHRTGLRPGYRTIAGVTGLSLNTAVKSVSVLTDKGLIAVERSCWFNEVGLKRNGNNIYTILPTRVAVEDAHQRQLRRLELDAQHRRALQRQENHAHRHPSAAPCGPSSYTEG